MTWQETPPPSGGAQPPGWTPAPPAPPPGQGTGYPGVTGYPPGYPADQPAGYPARGWQAPPPGYGPAPGVEFAPHGARLVAYIVDGFILGLVTTVVAIVGAILIFAGLATAGATAAVGVLVLIVALFVVGLGYFPWFWAHGGQTPGMRMFGLRVVRDEDGGPVDGGQAVLRLVGYWVSGFVFYLGFAWVLIDARRRGWHDLLAGTVVIATP
jgi:uncharacterized RDD family membrane protein YckC